MSGWEQYLDLVENGSIEDKALFMTMIEYYQKFVIPVRGFYMGGYMNEDGSFNYQKYYEEHYNYYDGSSILSDAVNSALSIVKYWDDIDINMTVFDVEDNKDMAFVMRLENGGIIKYGKTPTWTSLFPDKHSILFSLSHDLYDTIADATMLAYGKGYKCTYDLYESPLNTIVGHRQYGLRSVDL